MDNSSLQVIIAGITLTVAVVTPFLANVATNIHDTKIHKLDLKFQKQSAYLQKQQEVFSEFINISSQYIIDSRYSSDKAAFMKIANEILLYVDSNTGAEIKKLCDFVYSRKNDEATKQLTAVTELLGLLLKESELQFPKL